MDEIQTLFEQALNQVPRFILEQRLPQILKRAGIPVTDASIKLLADHILSGNEGQVHIEGIGDDATIEITDEDTAHIMGAVDRFLGEQLEGVVSKTAGDVADVLLKTLRKRWPAEFQAQQADMEGFRDRLERRWGRALGKLRMLLTIVREFVQTVQQRKHRGKPGKLSRFDDVMLRLLTRACQVTSEIITLLENGFADGAMARWRTLHEIAIVAEVVAQFGEEIAERYVYYQIVESFQSMKAYERHHKSLGFKPLPKTKKQKIESDYRKVIKKFGKKFGEENGWAAHHLKVPDNQRVTLARLEQECGEALMRSYYKMASHNVHAGPKGLYFKLGNLDVPSPLIAGASNAGLMEPAQNAAVTLVKIAVLMIGDNSTMDDLVAGKIIQRLQREIPLEFDKAERKLKRDHKRFSVSRIASAEGA